VKILEPDDFLRPDMSANVAFDTPDSTGAEQKARTNFEAPPSTERDGSVFVVAEGVVHRRPIKDLIGGEDVVLAPPENMRDGMRVKIKEKQ